MFTTPSEPVAESTRSWTLFDLQRPGDGEVVEDYSWMKKRKAKPRPRAISPNGRGLNSSLRRVTRGGRLSSSRPLHSDDDNAFTEGQPPCQNCDRPRRIQPRRIETRVRIFSTPSNMRAPVWAPFARNFARCAPGCQPARMGIHRPEDGRRSCHHSNRAIDVGAMICDGRVYTAYTSRFKSMATCMRSKMPTLYQQWHKRARYGDTLAHFDHAHFSITCYGGTFF